MTHMGERDYSQKLMGKQRKRLLGRLRYGYEDDIKMDIADKGSEVVGWIKLQSYITSHRFV